MGLSRSPSITEHGRLPTPARPGGTPRRRWTPAPRASRPRHLAPVSAARTRTTRFGLARPDRWTSCTPTRRPAREATARGGVRPTKRRVASDRADAVVCTALVPHPVITRAFRAVFARRSGNDRFGSAATRSDTLDVMAFISNHYIRQGAWPRGGTWRTRRPAARAGHAAPRPPPMAPRTAMPAAPTFAFPRRGMLAVSPPRPARRAGGVRPCHACPPRRPAVRTNSCPAASSASSRRRRRPPIRRGR